jgi:MFS family permease
MHEEEPPQPPPEWGSATGAPRSGSAEDTAGAPTDTGPHRTRRVGAATGRTLRRTGTGGARAATYVFRQARRASHAEGAGQSGLSRIIELHAFNAAGDAAVAISLAGTLFFSVGTAEARSQVALFLAITMVPFAVVAPLIGPVLDRFSHGRRWAIGLTMAARSFLCWVLAGQVVDESIGMFAATLGVLVASKAYGVTRAAAVPRVVPAELGLVKANSRISLAGIVGAGISAPLALLASLAGPEWSLRYAFLVFAGGTVLAILLPAKVDDAAGEEQASLAGGPRRARVPPLVVRALRCNAGLRLLSGFLTLFMAFLLREEPIPGWEDRPELLLGVVIGSAGLGNSIGIGLGNVLRNVKPQLVVVIVLLADTVATITAAAFYGLVTVVLLGLTAGVSQALGKLSLDSLIQSEVPVRTRSSAFARSETLLQLSWVVGGFIGIALPLVAQVGLGVAGALLLAISLWVVAQVRGGSTPPASAPPPPAQTTPER